MKKNELLENTKRIKGMITEMGADLVGVTDVNGLRDLKAYPADLLNPFTSAISIAVQFPIAIFDTILNKPSSIYSNYYRVVNSKLDEIAFRISLAIQAEGFNSLPIPASDYVDVENFYGTISHKAIARMAGLGWQGKNLLIITPQFGSRVRLVTVLTTIPLMPDTPIKNRCGDCMLCYDACPAHAIKGVNTADHYKDRDEALHFSKCVEKLSEFKNIPGIGAMLCGVCIRVCPFSRKGKETKIR